MDTRLEKLKKVIYEQIKRVESDQNENLLEIIYLYYDGYQ